MDKQALDKALLLAHSMVSHPVAFGTVDCVEDAGDTMVYLLAEVAKLRAALLDCARKAEALKRDCGPDPESAHALRNAQYQAISTEAHVALGTLRGPAPEARMPREAIAMLWNSLPIDTDAEAVVSFARGVERYHGLGA